MKAEQNALLAAGVFLLAGWLVPPLHFLTLPLQLLYTHLHEMGHAIAAMVTGGSEITIRVFGNGSGVTSSLGGIYLLISPAGYVGATAMGAGILALATNAKGARTALLAVAAMLAFTVLFWLRGDAVGLVTAFGYILLLSGLAMFTKGLTAVFLAQLVGLQLCLASLQSVLSLLNIGAVWSDRNDSQLLAAETGIPALFWAFLWSAVSITILYWAVRRSWTAMSSTGTATSPNTFPG